MSINPTTSPRHAYDPSATSSGDISRELNLLLDEIAATSPQMKAAMDEIKSGLAGNPPKPPPGVNQSPAARQAYKTKLLTWLAGAARAVGAMQSGGAALGAAAK